MPSSWGMSRARERGGQGVDDAGDQEAQQGVDAAQAQHEGELAAGKGHGGQHQHTPDLVQHDGQQPDGHEARGAPEADVDGHALHGDGLVDRPTAPRCRPP